MYSKNALYSYFFKVDEQLVLSNSLSVVFYYIVTPILFQSPMFTQLQWQWFFSSVWQILSGFQFFSEKLWFYVYCQLRARRALSIFKDIPLRTRRVLSLYKVYGDSALLVLNGTRLNSDSVLLALNWWYLIIMKVCKCIFSILFIPIYDQLFSFAEKHILDKQTEPIGIVIIDWNLSTFQRKILISDSQVLKYT